MSAELSGQSWKVLDECSRGFTLRQGSAHYPRLSTWPAEGQYVSLCWFGSVLHSKVQFLKYEKIVAASPAVDTRYTSTFTSATPNSSSMHADSIETAS